MQNIFLNNKNNHKARSSFLSISLVIIIQLYNFTQFDEYHFSALKYLFTYMLIQIKIPLENIFSRILNQPPFELISANHATFIILRTKPFEEYKIVQKLTNPRRTEL